MPTRLIRENILTSDTVVQLKWHERWFYLGLLLKSDDYGLFDARPAILKALIFALDGERVNEQDVKGFLLRCEELGLVRSYTVDGHAYGQVLKFGQQYKSAPKHPLPEWAAPEEYQPKPKKSGTKRNESARSVTSRNEAQRVEKIRHLDEDGDGDEDGDERDMATQPRRATPSREDVRRVMGSLMIATLSGKVMDECVERYMLSMEACDWADSKGTPIRRWQPHAKLWAKRYAENLAKGSPKASTSTQKDCNAPGRYR